MPSTAELCLLLWLLSKSSQGRAAALWGHLVAQVAPLVSLKGSPLHHRTTTCASILAASDSDISDSQEESPEVKFGGRKYREPV